MKSITYFIWAILLTFCTTERREQIAIEVSPPTEKPIVTDSIVISQHAIKIKPSVLVLPPYDEIHNEGISPDVMKYLENVISNDTSVALIKFPLKKLMNTPYQNVFDKKYCKPILEVVEVQIIIMSKLDHVASTGKMSTDTWNLRLRMYNSITNVQIDSKIKANGLTSIELQELLLESQKELNMELNETAHLLKEP